MTKYPPPPDAPPPAVNSAAEGLSIAREQARKYLLNAVFLWAAIAFGNSEASLWTRLQAARLIAEVAGAIPQAIPAAPQLRDEGSDGGEPP